MKRPSINPREWRLLLATFGVVFLVLHYLVVWPWWQHERVTVVELKKLRAEAAYRGEVLSHVEGWKKELAGLVRRQDADSPHMGSQEIWMKHFESLAEKSGVQLLQRRSARNGEKSPDQLRVDCSMQGSLEAVVKFMNVLLQDISHPQVESCQLSPLKAGEDKLKGQLRLTVVLKSSLSK